jgi:prepilin-type N-terminal cleavage/methylation domain-containing protein
MMSGNGLRGFTLLEVMVAFAILSAGLDAMFEALGASFHASHHCAARSET